MGMYIVFFVYGVPCILFLLFTFPVMYLERDLKWIIILSFFSSLGVAPQQLN